MEYRIIEAPTHPEADEFGNGLVNLAQPRLGASVVYATDDFFADKSRMLNPDPAVFVVGKYDDNGKWMDGWESRRKRSTGYDYAIIKLGQPGIISRVDFDTSHFTGNYAPAASLEGCVSADTIPSADTVWLPMLLPQRLGPNNHFLHEVQNVGAITHVRLNIFPDGGMARLRLYGHFAIDWSKRDTRLEYDFAALENGARGLACSDAHYGRPENILAPGRGINMGDGWETRRRREPGFDWCLIRLGAACHIERIEVDTAHFKGNFPESCSLQAALIQDLPVQALIAQCQFWPTLMERQKLQMDHIHTFSTPLAALGAVNALRLNIHPDGGVSRLRVFGRYAG